MTSSEKYLRGWGIETVTRQKFNGPEVGEQRTPHAVRADGPRDVAECGKQVQEVTDIPWSQGGLAIFKCPACVDRTR
jgi:hypothetical protein